MASYEWDHDKQQNVSLLLSLLGSPDYGNYSQKIKLLLQQLDRYTPEFFQKLMSDPEARNKTLESLRNVTQRWRSHNPISMSRISNLEALRLHNQLYQSLIIFDWTKAGQILSDMGFGPDIVTNLRSDPKFRTQTIRIMSDKIDQWQQRTGFTLDKLFVEDEIIPEATAQIARNVLNNDFTQELYLAGAKSLKFQALASLPGGIAAIEKYYQAPITGDVDKFLRFYNVNHYTADCSQYLVHRRSCIQLQTQALAERGDYPAILALLKSKEMAKYRDEVVKDAIEAFALVGRKDLMDNLRQYVLDNDITLDDVHIEGGYALYEAINGTVDGFIQRLRRGYDQAPAEEDEEDREQYLRFLDTFLWQGIEKALQYNRMDFIQELIGRLLELDFLDIGEEGHVIGTIIQAAIGEGRIDVAELLDETHGRHYTLSILAKAAMTCDKEIIDRYTVDLQDVPEYELLLGVAFDAECSYLMDKLLPYMDGIYQLSDRPLFSGSQSTRMSGRIIPMVRKRMTKYLKLFLDKYGETTFQHNHALTLMSRMLDAAAGAKRYDNFNLILNHPATSPYLEKLWYAILGDRYESFTSISTKYLILKTMLLDGLHRLDNPYNSLYHEVSSGDTTAVKVFVEWLLDRGANIPRDIYDLILALDGSHRPFPNDIGRQIQRLAPLVV